MEQVIIGVDPHKLSATIEVVDDHEQLLGSGRFTTDQAGYAAMRTYAKTWPDRLWAVEGSNGAGRPLAQRLLEDGEQVVDVPAKLAARVRGGGPSGSVGWLLSLIRDPFYSRARTPETRCAGSRCGDADLRSARESEPLSGRSPADVCGGRASR